jgi:hypothetical protein
LGLPGQQVTRLLPILPLCGEPMLIAADRIGRRDTLMITSFCNDTNLDPESSLWLRIYCSDSIVQTPSSGVGGRVRRALAGIEVLKSQHH